jgi:hypothetical protein
MSGVPPPFGLPPSPQVMILASSDGGFVCPDNYICSPWNFKSKSILIGLLSAFGGSMLSLITYLMKKYVKQNNAMKKIPALDPIIEDVESAAIEVR